MSSLPQAPPSEPTAVPFSEPLPDASTRQAVSRFWKKYVTFSGRASRSEFWRWYFVAVVVNFVLSFLGRIDGGMGAVFAAVAVTWGLATFLPTLALFWRRLHDANRSGLWALVPMLFSVIGSVLLLVAFVAIGMDAGENASSPSASLCFVLAGVAFLSALVAVVILSLLSSKPAGARFDRRR